MFEQFLVDVMGDDEFAIDEAREEFEAILNDDNDNQ